MGLMRTALSMQAGHGSQLMPLPMSNTLLQPYPPHTAGRLRIVAGRAAGAAAALLHARDRGAGRRTRPSGARLLAGFLGASAQQLQPHELEEVAAQTAGGSTL